MIALGLLNIYPNACGYGCMLDEKDLAILKALEEDSRRTTKAISEDLGIPRATVHERIKRMAEKGIIKRFTISLDHSALGEPIAAFILVSFLPNARWLSAFPIWMAFMRSISSLESMTCW
jgi:DNA-binding Lrp family transcriptional regulator